MTYPDSPYLYDDPRFLYDEAIFWNGDIVIPDPPAAVVVFRGGGSTSVTTRHTEMPLQNRKKIIPPEHRVIFDLEILAAIYSANSIKTDFPEIIKKYHLNHGDIEVSIQKFIHRENLLSVSGIQTSNDKKQTNIQINENIKVMSNRTIVSGSMETRIKGSKVVIKSGPIMLKVKK